jgi:transglutaminase-like putative cysteine protease
VIYALRHRTTYKYGSEVTFARCALRLTPLSSAGQTVLESRVRVTPEPKYTVWRTGPFGEQVLTVIIDAPHRALVIEATARVDVHAAPVPETDDSPTWEAVRESALGTSLLGPDGPASYLFPTARTPLTAAITDYARASFPPGRPVIEAAAELMRRIHADFTYDAKATEVSTPVAEAFAARRGVCQDFAHIMIAGLRGLNLPAAYVSGYLRTIPPPGQPRLEGADATHAWVSVWCGQAAGWIGMDPTNAIFAQNDHIVLAIGRDYSDVAPIDGIILAPGGQKIKVEVDVIPEGEGAADGVLWPAFGGRAQESGAQR